MKTNVIIKFAVVAMAAFGAYAFNGSNANDLKPFYINEGGLCTNILAGCSDSGDFNCKISMQDSPTIYELGCVRVIQHSTNEVVDWLPINP